MNEQRRRGNGETERRRKEASKQEKTSLPCSEFSLMLSTLKAKSGLKISRARTAKCDATGATSFRRPGVSSNKKNHS